MRVAWVLADGEPGAAARVAEAHVRHLRAAGHRVDVVVAAAGAAPFAGHTTLADGTLALAHATAAYDVAAAASWRAWYAMFALDARAHASLHLSDEGAAPLVERSRREPGVARAAARPGLLPGDGVVLAPLGVDAALFHPAERSGARRILVAGEGPATRAALAGAGAADEIWHLGSGRLGRRVAPVPLDSMPALLRACHVLVDVEPGAGLLAAEMAATGGAVIGATPAVRGWDEGCAAFARVLEEARPLPGWRRDELRALHELLLRDEARPDLADAVRALADSARQLGRRLARRLAPPRRAPRARLPQRSFEGGHGGEGGLRPGEPVVFAGRACYFRSSWHEAVAAGWGIELPIGHEPRVALDTLPALCERSGARTCVVFQPELLAQAPAAAAELRARGVRLVAYSTEPVPHDGAGEVHWDLLRRLETLRPARAVPWDLFLHFDPASLGTLRREGFPAPRARPLPTSETLFFPEPPESGELDIDLLFFGWSTPHREAFLHPLEHRYRTVHVAHGLFDEDARRLMNRARLVVNLHAHGYPSFENRCVQALFCGRPLASEPLSNDLLRPGIDHTVVRTPGELAALMAAVVAAPAPPPPAPFGRAPFLVAGLRDLLAETGRP